MVDLWIDNPFLESEHSTSESTNLMNLDFLDDTDGGHLIIKMVFVHGFSASTN